MRITISFISTSEIVTLDVPESITVQDFKALIASELPSVPPNAQHLYHNGRLLGDQTRNLQQYGVVNDDLIVLHSRAPGGQQQQAGGVPRRSQQQHPQQQQQHPQQQQGGGHDPELIRLQVLGDPRLLGQLRESQPELVAAVNDPERFAQTFRNLEQQRVEMERQKQREIQMLNEEPFNIEAQRKIEELIRQEAVMENLQSALEHNPEAFGRVTMLYIPVEVNGVKVKAFVDSGAQATIMSPSCAERCGIMRLVDQRFAGIARGVGTAKILGRVHSAQIRIGNLFLACSFTVMEGKDVDLLLGLDMLKRHQAMLDFRKGCLVIQDEQVEFLGESEIPKNDYEMEAKNEPTVEGPGGVKVGGRTGALIEPSIQSTPARYGGASGSGGGGAQSSAQQPTQPQQLPQQPAAQPSYTAEAVEQLEGLGFSKQQAVAALNATGGDVNMAATLLFQ